MRLQIAAVLLFFVGSQSRADQIRITIDSESPRRARVQATLSPTSEGELLLTRDADDSGIEGGWARFLEDLHIWDAQGESVAIVSSAVGRFELPADSGPFRIEYSMRLEHDQVENMPGADELAWARPDSVLWTGRALLFEGATATDIDVTFDLPEGWRATTPWQVIEPGRKFRAGDTDALLDSAFIVGEHFEALLGDGPDAPVRIALAGPNAISKSTVVVDSVERYLGIFGEMFGGPPDGRLLLVAADGSFWGGGVMGTTISMLMGGALDDSTLPMLRFVTVHEAFHLWNANFPYRGDEGKETLYWMSEGTASYYAMRSQVGAGDLPTKVALEQLAEEITKYRASRGELSMVDAGPVKLSHYDLIYSGGFVASMALDIAIRTRSEDRHSLDDVLRSLHSGPGRSILLDIETLPDLVESTTGVCVDDLLDCCITGSAELPVADLFAHLGLEMTATGDSLQIVQSSAASSETQRWEAWKLGSD